MPKLHYPIFFDSFACKCSACRRTCCGSDWVIGLSMQEYESNLNNPNPTCRELARNGLHCVEDGTEELFAACTPDENGLCRILSKDGLCSWQLLEGHCVGAVCDEFPRFHMRYLSDEYVFPTLACEAVVEAIWHSGSDFSLTHTEKDAPGCIQNIIISEDALNKRPVFKYYPAAIATGIKLFQDRKFSLDDRMVLMANLACLLDYLEKQGKTDFIPSAMERFMEEQNLSSILERFSEYSISPAALLTVNCKTMIRQFELPQFLPQALSVLEGLGFEINREEGSEGGLRVELKDREAYLRRREMLKPFMEKHIGFFEKLLICEFLRGMTFFTEPDIFSSFCIFNCWYALLKGTICGLFESDPDISRLTDSIVVMQRMFTHHGEEYGNTLQFLEAIRMKDLGSMVALAKG